MSPAAPAQENRIVTRRQPANKWPLSNFGFRNERGRTYSVDDKNIEPGNVIGDNQAALRKRCPLSIKADSQNFQYLMRPLALQVFTPLPANKRIKQSGAKANPGKVHCQPHTADKANHPRRR